MTETLDSVPGSDEIEARLATERPRLVGLCARLSGDASMAEDLAQETLAEAWRLLAKLRQPEGISAWLNAIARNVCLRWARAHGRDEAHTARPVASSDEGVAGDLDALPAGGDELTIALERGELIALLDRALALLPAETRAVLVGTYIREQPHAELAARLGLSDGALRVRLHRGRLALRHALAAELRDEAGALGLALPEEEPESGWWQTRIWCPFCGRHPLEYRMDRECGSYTYRCVGRCAGEGIIAGWTHPPVGGLSSPKPVLTRHCLRLDTFYRGLLAAGRGRCEMCGGPLVVGVRTPHEAWGPLPREHGILIGCPGCDDFDTSTAWHVILDTPEAQRFWRRHARMRALPVCEVEAEGSPALVSGFEAVEGQARLMIVSDRQTYRVLRAYGEGDAG